VHCIIKSSKLLASIKRINYLFCLLYKKSMKRVAIFGKSEENSKHLKSLLSRFNFIIDETNPELVISYGGDGTFLMSERAFPGVPKVLIRDSNICNKCHNHPIDHVFEMISKGDYKLINLIKLKGVVNNKKLLVCTNDFVIRNKLPTHALRFKLFINDKQIDGELIGDGLVISTVFGSTGYYYSITKKSFSKGIGVAFNNIHKKIKHLVIKERDEIKIEITRGDAVLVADNNPEIIELCENDVVQIKKTEQIARLIELI